MIDKINWQKEVEKLRDADTHPEEPFRTIALPWKSNRLREIVSAIENGDIGLTGRVRFQNCILPSQTKDKALEIRTACFRWELTIPFKESITVYLDVENDEDDVLIRLFW